MSNAQRLLLLGGAVVVLVVGFVLLSPGGDGGDEGAGTTATAPAATSDVPATTATAPAARPEPAATIVVRGGKPVGGVRTITVAKRERVRIAVRSPDTTDEVHLHGYDIKRDLEAGGRVSFSFTATAEGIFEMELEGSATQIAKLVVQPD